MIEWKVCHELVSVLEEFACSMYIRKRAKDIVKVRSDMLKDKCGLNKLDPKKHFSIASLPPCRLALEPIIRLVCGKELI